MCSSSVFPRTRVPRERQGRKRTVLCSQSVCVCVCESVHHICDLKRTCAVLSRSAVLSSDVIGSSGTVACLLSGGLTRTDKTDAAVWVVVRSRTNRRPLASLALACASSSSSSILVTLRCRRYPLQTGRSRAAAAVALALYIYSICQSPSASRSKGKAQVKREVILSGPDTVSSQREERDHARGGGWVAHVLLGSDQ
jgi:hypothetical protein